ncbi:hypothetical protein DH86_00002918 [Scytalidium sp. 3C]|nr:hypothetical protein DH86_00002918 [Scytalidium sp. 3C]
MVQGSIFRATRFGNSAMFCLPKHKECAVLLDFRPQLPIVTYLSHLNGTNGSDTRETLHHR